MAPPSMFLILTLIILSITCRANIVFTWTQPTCDPTIGGWKGCMRGQVCELNGTCSMASTHHAFQPRAYSNNGKCGPQNGGLICNSNSGVYTGGCCSQYGWCGDDEAHCGPGCVSGCSSSDSKYSTDGKCGPSNGNLLCDPNSSVYTGTCCSQYGWCGNTPAHCGQGCVSSCSAINPTTLSTATFGHASSVTQARGEPTLVPLPGGSGKPGTVTTNGTCGVSYGGTTCGDWLKGSCCSMYGWCGNTTAHCGAGCQSGPCTNGAEPQAPGPSPAPMNVNPGSFKIVGQSGVPVMHAGLMPNGRAFFLDKVENYTQLKLPNGYYAYSAEYDPETNEAVPLSYKTNAFCSGGAFLPDGTMLNMGGNAPLSFIDPYVGNGFNAIRLLTRSSTSAALDGQSWSESGIKLNSDRWYPSAQILPDGTLFVASGSLNGLNPAVMENNNPTFEILNTRGVTNGHSVEMDILVKNQPYYMYPFMHLLRDGSLFVFVSKSAEIFDVSSQTTIKTLPDLPGDFRTYPNTGGSVLLPLSSANSYDPEVVICGGGAYQDITSPTDASCGRILPLSETPRWEMDSMPEGRTMVEGALLPDGTVIWLNGCSQGAQGFALCIDPTYEALIYDPEAPLGQRFTTGATSTIARLYHSVAFLLLDGTLMVAGSNPVEQPILVPDAANPYVTEFRVEIYTPPYLSGENTNRRPTAIRLSSTSLTADGSVFTVALTVPTSAQGVTVSLYYGGFVTHSLHMGHRMIVLDTEGWKDGEAHQSLKVTMPPNSNIAPPGPYVIYVMCDRVPGVGQFVSVA